MRIAAGWWCFFICLHAFATAVMVGWKIASLHQLAPGQEYGTPFFHAMATSDWFGSVISLALLVAAPLLARRYCSISIRILDALSERVAAVALAASLMLGLGTRFIYRDYPFWMDEYAATFQAEVFAAGKLVGKWPPCAAPLMVSPVYASGQFFFCNYETGEILSQYWPCHALLIAPFALVGLEWALNPLLAALAIMLIASLARHFAGPRAAGLAVLLTIASPVFHAHGISFYSMMSHLVANLSYARLLVQPTASRSITAGCIGGFALALHNPFPHALFAGPWILWLTASRRWLSAALVIASTLAVFGLIDGAWQRTQQAVRLTSSHTANMPEITAAHRDADETRFSWLEFPARVYRYITSLTVPSASVAASGRTYSLVREIAWDAPALVGLAIMGWSVGTRGAASALAGSALITFLGYALAPFDGGLGWGSRYMFSAWCALPVLAAATCARSATPHHRLVSGVVMTAVGSILLCVPIRLFEIRSLIDATLRQSPSSSVQSTDAAPDRVWVFLAGGRMARQDFIRNDPLFRRGPFILYGQGRYQDEHNIRFIASQLGLTPHHIGSTRTGDLWTLKAGPQPPDEVKP